VVVIGAATPAMDCVGTAVRQGAKSVTCPLPAVTARLMPAASAKWPMPKNEASCSNGWPHTRKPSSTQVGQGKAVRAAKMKLGEPMPPGRPEAR